ncbi:MAG TPA: tetratricopeptide repeat protein [Anaerolineae bacterium]|nr:tetratricopeptide repeat protein [Anaerolineae bacterium]
MNDTERRYREAMSQGHSAAWDMNWEAAAEYYRRALEYKPDDFQALTNLALAYYEMGRYQEALSVYAKAAKQNPQDPIPWEKLALIHQRRGEIQAAARAALQAAEAHARQGDIHKAIENWMRVIRLDPENLQAHARLALVYERTKRLNDGVQEHLALAALLQARGKAQQALQAVEHALKLIPNHPDALQARALLMRGRPLPKPRRPKGGTAPLRMARIREMEQQEESDTLPVTPTQDAIAEARRRALTALAELLFATVEEEDTDTTAARRPSIEALLRGLPTNPNARKAHRARVLLLLGQGVDFQTQGKYDQAAAELERVHKAGLHHPALAFDLGWLYATLERPKKALRYLQEAVLHPDYALASHLLLGRLYRQEDRLHEAAQEYLAALQQADATTLKDKQQRQAMIQLYEPVAQALSQEENEARLEQFMDSVEHLLSTPDWQKKVQDARAQLPPPPPGAPPMPLAEVLFQAESGQVIEAFSRILRLREQRSLHAAMEEAHLALIHAPTYLPLHTLIGDLLEEMGRTSQAVEKYAMVGGTYAVRGEGERAVEHFRRALRLAPMDLDMRLALIDTLVAQERIEEALAEYIALAETYYRLAEIRLAFQTYEEALRLSQRLPQGGNSWQMQILRRLADLAEQALDWRRALRYYEQIRSLAPEDLESRWQVIRLHLRLGQKSQAVILLDDTLKLARQHLQEAEILHLVEQIANDFPEAPELRLTLGRLYAAAGEKERAVEILDAAGEAFLANGDRQKAIRAIKAILALDPPQAADYRRALQALSEEPD